MSNWKIEESNEETKITNKTKGLTLFIEEDKITIRKDRFNPDHVSLHVVVL